MSEVILNARRLGNYATFRRGGEQDSARRRRIERLKQLNSKLHESSEDDDDDCRSTKTDGAVGRTRRIRWSREDLLLSTPTSPKKKLASKASKLSMEEREEAEMVRDPNGQQEEEEQEAETTLEEEYDSITSTSEEGNGDQCNIDAKVEFNATATFVRRPGEKEPPLPPRDWGGRQGQLKAKPPAPPPHHC